ncbi:MAG: 23S rRNA (uracil(1939)-C(5))-methyltransferase RlmD [archaeon]
MATPICKYFGICGGCQLQHLDYSVQLENKKKNVSFLLGVNENEVQVFSDKEYNYRNRMDFVFHNSGAGLREKGKWYNIIDIDYCAIADIKLNSLLKEVKCNFGSVDSFDTKKRNGIYYNLVIRTPQNDSSISFVLNPKSSRIAEAVEKIKDYSKKSAANNVIITYSDSDSTSSDFFIVKGKDMLNETLIGKKFMYSVQGFFQNNHAVAQKMQEYCNNIFKKHETKNAYLLDLYGGVGTFGIINSELFKEVTTIESVKECTDSANVNKELNNANNVKAITLDASKLKKIEFKKPLFLLTDPPRSGMHQDTIRQINMLLPEVIVYVSCNPEQLAKDIRKFDNYKLVNTAMFDMFPQTQHIEVVVELIKQQ